MPLEAPTGLVERHVTLRTGVDRGSGDVTLKMMPDRVILFAAFRQVAEQKRAVVRFALKG